MLGQTVIRFMCLPLIAKIVEAKHVYANIFVFDTSKRKNRHENAIR